MCDCNNKAYRNATDIPEYDYLQSVLLSFTPTANGIDSQVVTLDSAYSTVVGVMIVPVSGSTVSDNMTVSVQADADNYLAIQPLHIEALSISSRQNPLDAVLDTSKRLFQAKQQTSTIFVKDYSGADNTLTANVVFLLKK